MIRRAAPGALLDLHTHLLLRLAELPMGAARGPAVEVAAGLQVFLVHSPRLALADGRTLALERKDAALLALLAIEGPTPRARAAALLWPDVDGDAARNNLRQRLFRLRRTAGRDVVDADNVLRLADGIAHDLAAVGERLQGDPAAAQGELLGSLDYTDLGEMGEWVQAAREQ
jgi:DNA-binding SARP family transcriptional activator